MGVYGWGRAGVRIRPFRHGSGARVEGETCESTCWSGCGCVGGTLKTLNPKTLKL